MRLASMIYPRMWAVVCEARAPTRLHRKRDERPTIVQMFGAHRDARACADDLVGPGRACVCAGGLEYRRRHRVVRYEAKL